MTRKPRHNYGPTIGFGPSARPTSPHPDSSVGRAARQGVEYLPGQAELLGCEPNISNSTRRLNAAPLKPTKPQKCCDIGLFSDDARQVDLEDFTKGRR